MDDDEDQKKNRVNTGQLLFIAFAIAGFFSFVVLLAKLGI